MARGHAFWVIVTGTSPTAFRARRREDLLPTLHQLQRTQPDAVVRWFDRGKLWESPIEAREALRSRGRRPAAGERRGPEWRPGGSHEDPRARFKRTRDEKRAQFKRRQVRGRQQSEKGGPPAGETGPRSKPKRPWGRHPSRKAAGPRGPRQPRKPRR